jgi:outer membrane protein assembly factor BamB
MPAVVGPDQATTWIGNGTMVISSDGAQNGVIWATQPLSVTNQFTKPGKLIAYDALTGKHIWDSYVNKMRDDLGYHAHQSYPTVANGKVYVPSWTGSMVVGDRATTSLGQLHVYGLLQ